MSGRALQSWLTAFFHASTGVSKRDGQRAEVLATDRTSADSFGASDASPARRKELPLGAAVENTDRS